MQRERCFLCSRCDDYDSRDEKASFVRFVVVVVSCLVDVMLMRCVGSRMAVNHVSIDLDRRHARDCDMFTNGINSSDLTTESQSCRSSWRKS